MGNWDTRLLALTWGSEWKGKRIRFIGDCKGLCQCLRKGYAKAPAMAGLIRAFRRLLPEAEERPTTGMVDPTRDPWFE